MRTGTATDLIRYFERFEEESTQMNQPEILLQTLHIGGIPVVKVRKGGQILYRLANGVAIQSLTPLQRQTVTTEIMRLHAMDLASGAHPADSAPQNAHRHIESTVPDAEELHRFTEVKRRVAAEIGRDFDRATNPDIKRSFSSRLDAFERLSAYHVFHRREDDDDNQHVLFQHQMEVNVTNFLVRAGKTLERLQHGRLKSSQHFASDMQLLIERLLLMDERQKLNNMASQKGFVPNDPSASASEMPHIPGFMEPSDALENSEENDASDSESSVTSDAVSESDDDDSNYSE